MLGKLFYIYYKRFRVQREGGYMAQKEAAIGEWHLMIEGDKIYIANDKADLSFAVAAGELNDLIVGLLVINPGPNPELITSATMAREFDATPATGARWFELGLVPGAMVAQDPAYTRYVVARGALGEFKRPARGNPDFSKK